MTQEYTIILTPTAQKQYEDIGAYIAFTLQAPLAAESTLVRIRDKFSTLSFSPESYSLVPDEPWHSKGLRRVLINNYIIYFYVDQDARIVTIQAIIYAKRDQAAVLEAFTITE